MPRSWLFGTRRGKNLNDRRTDVIYVTLLVARVLEHIIIICQFK